VAGLLPPTKGEILVDGARVEGVGRDRGMVFQAYTSFAWLTVQENVEYGLRLRGVDEAERKEQAAKYLEAVGLADSAKKYPRELSGGMKQRVAIARGMAMEPDILLMDEPFAALDALTRRTCQDELLQLWAETKFTVLFVTHSIAEAIKIGNRILLLSPHPGRVKAEVVDVDQVSGEDGSAGRLEKQIHDLLFADAVTAH
jgi:NitT/TauT family transport system ATP-binding protein